MIERLRARQEWQFFAVLPRAHAGLAAAWWILLVLSGVLPAVFAVATGQTIRAVESADRLGPALAFVGVVFVLMLIVGPVLTAVSMNLGNLLSAWLNERLINSCVDPPGIGHLEDPELADDLTTSREFDRGMTGPPMYLNLDFIATSLVGTVGGVASAVVLAGFNWWAPMVLVLAWASTHWLLRESGVWKDRNTPEVRSAQRHADYAYRLAVDPQPAKELRLFGLAGWTVARFIERRKLLFELQQRATRLRERSVALCMIIVVARERGRLRCSRVAGRLGHAAAGPFRGVRAGRARRQPDRLRRAQLGLGRRVGAGRCGRPARSGDGSVGCSAARLGAGGRTIRPARSRSATSPSAIRAPTAGCSPA